MEWKVKEGDRVEEDQDLVDIETEKAVFTLPSPAAGTVLKINYREGDTIYVGAADGKLYAITGSAN